MKTLSFLAAAAVSACCAGAQTIAELPWDGLLTAGPNAVDVADDTLDNWVVEDVGFDHALDLRRFFCRGVTPGFSTAVSEVTVRIYRGFPPTGGHLVGQSIPGSGRTNGTHFIADFDTLRLLPGDYFIAWTVAPLTGSIAVSFATAANYTTGRGEPNNAWLWNPGGGRGFPGNYLAVPQDLDGNGQIGVNFRLVGEFVCPADLTGASDPADPSYGIADGQVDISDFFYYLDQFVAGNLAVADLTGSSDPSDPGYGVPDGMLDLSDFFVFLDLFAAGCP
ncbi:MAG: hypothetical protein KF866_10340 [Phycisphaeraceae bacterium]|nr:hypothetical protein [Phycisphaeraceae bacterium]